MTTQMIIRVEANLKNTVSQLAKAEGKNLSELVRELLVNYTKERDMSAYIDNLWDRIGKNLTQNNISKIDIQKAIEQARSRNA
ncbi:MAG: CopG family transcriptional regulator [Deltaproteobacteria bacterium]|nr:MAG: CopG family transcriptional regulator [Deltaproteobacteria bacterium]